MCKIFGHWDWALNRMVAPFNFLHMCFRWGNFTHCCKGYKSHIFFLPKFLFCHKTETVAFTRIKKKKKSSAEILLSSTRIFLLLKYIPNVLTFEHCLWQYLIQISYYPGLTSEWSKCPWRLQGLIKRRKEMPLDFLSLTTNYGCLKGSIVF